MSGRFAFVSGLALAFAVSCGHPRTPASLADADRASQSPAARDSASLVPQAFAQAEAYRKQSRQAFDDGRIAASGILAERAVVAYEHAAVLARIARATLVAQSAQQSLTTSEAEVRSLEAEQQRVRAETDAIDMRIKVMREAEPLTPAGRADPAREAARLQATRVLVQDARLLCVAARLVNKDQPGLSEAEGDVGKLETALGGAPIIAPIDDARRARSKCLQSLTLARRSNTAAAASSDVVLSELSSKPGLAPVRDDRGVVLFLSQSGKPADVDAQMRSIAAVAKAHPEFPVLVVGHTRSANPDSADRARALARAKAVEKRLSENGLQRITVETSGPTQSLSSDPDPVAVIFVSPSS